MKNLLIIITWLASAVSMAQAPHLINYQAVARNASGNIVTSGSIGVKFEILQGSTSGTVSYAETNSASPSTAGIFNAAIGGGTPLTGTFSAINWATGPYYLRVSIDPAGGTSYSTVGTTQLLSVPYALYAEKAGNSTGAMPTGTLNGQTMYWNQPGNKWEVDNNILNNGNKVSIGDPLFNNNKLKVFSNSSADSAAIFAYKPNSSSNQVAVRGVAFGNSVNSGSLNVDPIGGGHFVGYNLNSSGTGVGVVAQGGSPSGDAVGIIAVGSSSSTALGRSVGLYATANGPNYGQAYSAVFDRGKAYFADTLVIATSGSVGDVLKRGNNGKAYWGAASGSGPWVQSTGSTTLTNANDNVSIGTSVTSAKLNVGTTTGFAGNDISIASNSTIDALQIFKLSGGGSALRLINGATTTNTSIASIAMISGNNPVGLDINISSNSPALQAVTTGSSAAVLGINSNGTGASVRGSKNATGVGNAGYFDINNPASSSDALVGLTMGTGAAIRAVTSTVTASALSLLLDGGHIKAVGPGLSVASTSVVGGFSAVAGANCTSCNDVRGIVSFSTGVTGFGTPNYAEVTFNFAKPYSTVPNVNITPLSDMQDLGYLVSTVTTTSFSIRVYRSSNKSVPLSVPASLFKFNYIVIE